MFAFGLSRTFAGIIVSRCLSGALNGNVAVVKVPPLSAPEGRAASLLRTVYDRRTIGLLINGALSAQADAAQDDTNQARAYSFLPLVVGIGGTLGPLIGGFTSEPVKQYPNIFGSWTLFATYPYLLPCAIGGSLAFLGAVLGVCVLKEVCRHALQSQVPHISCIQTLKRPSAAHKEGEAGQPLLSEPMSPVADETPAVDVAPRMTPLRELLTTRMLRVIASCASARRWGSF
jgi:MFS family permease